MLQAFNMHDRQQKIKLTPCLARNSCIVIMLAYFRVSLILSEQAYIGWLAASEQKERR